MAASNKVALEVEQKFTRDTGLSVVEMKLSELGSTKQGEKKMVDWYFDLPAPIELVLDAAEKTSSWQLKRGRTHKGDATIYEGLDGDDAIEAALSMLSELPTRKSRLRQNLRAMLYHNYRVPLVLCPLPVLKRIDLVRLFQETL